MSAESKSDLLFMKGTSGIEDYLVVARKDDVVLGFRPFKPALGGQMGVPGTLYFSGRLRAAWAKDVLPAAPESNVLNFNKPLPQPGEAYPDIEWAKSNSKRSSTIVGVFLPGSLPEGVQELISHLEDGTIARKMAAGLCETIGPEGMIFSRDQITGYLLAQVYGKYAQVLKVKSKVGSAISTAMTESVGTFSTQTALLTKAKEQLGEEGIAISFPTSPD